ncbi:MAG: glycosyltransferase family 39 protein [Acetobacteraceae bacterium]
MQARLLTALLLGCLVLAALALRLYRLQTEPVWYDEAATLGIASMDWRTIFGDIARLESSPPGFYGLSKIWLLLFGDDIGGMRLLPALCGALSIVPVWLIARAHISERAAWLAAGLLAMAASQVRFSQDLRTYTVLFLCYCAALLVAARLTEESPMDRPAWGAILGLGALQGAMLWLHSTAPLLIMTLNVFMLVAAFMRWQALRHAVLVVAFVDVVTVALGSVPLVHAINHIVEPQFVDRWIDAPDLREAATLYGRTLVAPYLNAWSPVAAAMFGAMAVAAVVAAVRRQNAIVLGLAAMLVTGVILLPAISRFVPVMLDRTILFLLAPLLLLVAAGAASLSRPAFLGCSAVLLLLQGFGFVHYQTIDVRREQWPAAAAVLHGRVGPLAPVIATEGVFQAIALELPLRAAGDNPRIIVIPPEADLEQFAAGKLAASRVSNPANICAMIAGSERVWLVARTMPQGVVNDPEYSARPAVRDALLAAGSHLLESTIVPGIEVEEWSSPRCR